MTDTTPDIPRFFSDPWPDGLSLSGIIGGTGPENLILAAMGVFGLAAALWMFAVVVRSVFRLRRTRLFPLFLPVWVYAVLVYDIGMYTGTKLSLLGNLPMALLYGFKVFLFDSDVSEVHSEFHSSWLYSANFALVHCLAALVSTLFILKYFGLNIRAWLRLQGAALWGRRPADTFVFWGAGDPSFRLAESIRARYACRRGCRIIMVRTGRGGDGGDDGGAGRVGFDRIFDFVSLTAADMERLQGLGCLTACTYSDVADMDVPPCGTDVIGGSLRLTALARLLRRRSGCRIHVLLLSDSAEDNLHAAAVLAADRTLRDFASGPGHSVTICCLARRNSLHGAVEDLYINDAIDLRVVDSSRISVEMLRRDPSCHPVNFVEVEPDATVATPFNSLVVGFGEVGTEAARFLYEFGAFVQAGGDRRMPRRSPFRIDIVDRDMADKTADFFCGADGVSLHAMDCRGDGFRQLLRRSLPDLNYIVVATDSDELNIAIAVRIFREAVRCRSTLDRFVILTRIRDDRDRRAERIAGHFNALWKTEAGKDDAEVIRIFGRDCDVFTWENIIDDTMSRRAREFADTYDRATTTREDKAAAMSAENKVAAKPELLTYSAVMKLRRTESQNIANALHAETKRRLAAAACGSNTDRHFPPQPLLRYRNEVVYTTPEGKEIPVAVARILDTLAQTEHLRWVASHEMLGYAFNPDEGPGYKDEARLYHNCLTDWENLSARTRSYDYNTVDISLGIITEENPIKQRPQNE